MVDVFIIKKKDGSPRVIFKPNEEEKRRNIAAFFKLIPVSVFFDEKKPFFPPYIQGFAPYRSNITNAIYHVGIIHVGIIRKTKKWYMVEHRFNCSLALDIADFFPSVTIPILMYSFEHYRLNEKKSMATNLDKEDFFPFTVFGRLAQGFPVSPYLANIAFYPLDKYIIGRLLMVFRPNEPFAYTRYADDITVSWSSSDIAEGRDKAEEVFKSIYDSFQTFRFGNLENPFKINPNKTKFMHNMKGQRRIITGVSVDSHGIYPPRYLKRRLRAMKHSGAPSHRIEGLEGYIKHIEETNERIVPYTQ